MPIPVISIQNYALFGLDKPEFHPFWAKQANYQGIGAFIATSGSCGQAPYSIQGKLKPESRLNARRHQELHGGNPYLFHDSRFVYFDGGTGSVGLFAITNQIDVNLRAYIATIVILGVYLWPPEDTPLNRLSLKIIRLNPVMRY